MDFSDQIKQFSQRVEQLKDTLTTEEATKTSIIMPFFAMLGYDVFNPQEFIPEFTADVGIKKGEKVDYAILADEQPVILIEAKWIGENLQRHDSQLFRYFGTTSAKFAILTNGKDYKFFTDLEEKNKMDEKPFLEVNILDVKESQLAELKKFHKSNFNVDAIFDTASELKYSNVFKNVFADQLQQPTDDFTRLFLSTCYDGVKTQAVVDKFRPVLKKSLNNYISELMNDKIKSALGAENAEVPVAEVIEEIIEKPSNINTTEEELESLFVVKNIIKTVLPVESITYKDTESYFGVLVNGNIRKWVCRIVLKESSKSIFIPTADKKEVKYQIENVYDIEKYTAELIESAKRFI